MTATGPVRVLVRADEPGPTIAPALHGQFVEHLGAGVYGGIWVGEDSRIPHVHGIRRDVVEALRRLRVPVVRWPGGCFADGYHWRDGVGERSRRPRRVNTSWGDAPEPNAFGTHEFMEFAELIGAAPYVNANVATGSPEEAAEWVAYLISDGTEAADLRRRNGRSRPWRLPYLGFGNEPWGCGGPMSASAYGARYRQFAAAVGPLADTWRIAAGAAGDDPAWTGTLMAEAALDFDALTVHQYTLPTGDWSAKGAARSFGEDEWISTIAGCLHMDAVIRTHASVMDAHDPGRRVALAVDEWGTWYDPEPGVDPATLRQPNGIRDALVAAITLGIFHAHADRVRLANVAQLVNVLQAMILTHDDGIVLTPTYHVFEMYRGFQGARALAVDADTPAYRRERFAVPAVLASAAATLDGRTLLALVNTLPFDDMEVTAEVAGGVGSSARVGRAGGRVLSAPRLDSVNDVGRPDAVVPTPLGRRLRARPGGLEVDLPPRSVTVIELA